MLIKYAILDLDHTLIRSTNMHVAWQRALAEHDALAKFEESWVGAAGRPLEISAGIALNCNPDHPRAHALVSSFWEHIGDGDPVEIDGAGVLLAELRRRGLRLFLSTASHPAPVTRWLAERGWEDHFELVLASTPEQMKGAAHYKAILAHLGATVAEFAPHSATIGDGHYDMRYGRDHGVALRIGFAPFVEGHEDKAISLRAAGANAIVRHLSEVVAVIFGDQAEVEPEEVLVARAVEQAETEEQPERRRKTRFNKFGGPARPSKR